MKLLVSIIVPIYKVPENFLRKCIESLINQTLKEIEIILVDDGSPDDCGIICDEYSKSDSRIKVIHKQNNGLSAARNTGVYAATGEWITFVDGDDWVDREMCEEAINVIDSETNVVFWNHVKEYNNRSLEYRFMKDIDKKIFVGDECKILQVKMLDYSSHISTAYAKLINRNFLLKSGIMHDEKLRQGAEGIDFNLHLFEKVNKAVFINRLFYHYVFNGESISVKHDEKNHYYVIRCFQKIRTFIDKSDNKENLLKKYYQRLIYVLIAIAINGYFSPVNKESYKEKVEKYIKILDLEIFQEAIEKANINNLSLERKITIELIKKRWFVLVNIIAYLRYKQLTSK